jgi:hypothetical protein
MDSGEYLLTKEEEMELALELLSVSDESELDRFLHKLLEKSWRGVRRVAPTLVSPISGVLKTVANATLPWVADVARGLPGPLPAVAGPALASVVSRALQREMEGVRTGDDELEVSRRFVRLAAMAARRAVTAPDAGVPAATMKAIRTVSTQMQNTDGAASAVAGRWSRRGNHIVVSNL